MNPTISKVTMCDIPVNMDVTGVKDYENKVKRIINGLPKYPTGIAFDLSDDL